MFYILHFLEGDRDYVFYGKECLVQTKKKTIGWMVELFLFVMPALFKETRSLYTLEYRVGIYNSFAVIIGNSFVIDWMKQVHYNKKLC